MLNEPIADAKSAAQEAVKRAVTLLMTTLRVDAIENRHCPTCDQGVPEDVRSRLKALLPPDATATTSADDTGVTALVQKFNLDGFEEKDIRG